MRPPPSAETPNGSRAICLARGAGWVAVALVLAWLMNLAWWGLLSPSARAEGGTEELVIPAGTAAAIATQQPFAFVPALISVPPGGTLRLVNRDAVAHRVGAWTVPPNGIAEIREAASDGQFSCTIHPSRTLAIDLRERPPIASTVLPALTLGIPLGLVVALTVAITTRLT